MVSRRLRTLAAAAAAVLLLVSTGRADMTISSDYQSDAAVFNSYQFSISTDLPHATTPVTLSITRPFIRGGGLTVAGWSVATTTVDHKLIISTRGGNIVNSAFIITGLLPTGANAEISNYQGTSTAARPMFDFSAMYFTNNVTLSLSNVYVTYTNEAATQNAIEVGGSLVGSNFGLYSALSISAMSTFGGECVVHLAGRQFASPITMTEYSVISLESVRTCELRTGVLCARNSFDLGSNSMIRVTKINAQACASSPSPSVFPVATFVVESGSIRLSGSSAIVLSDISMPATSSILETVEIGGGGSGSQRPSLELSLSGGSMFSVMNIAAKDFSTTYGSGIPQTQVNSIIYAGGWVLNGVSVSIYQNYGLGGTTPLTSTGAIPATGLCEPYSCLPSNTLSSTSTPPCSCICSDSSFGDNCLSKPLTVGRECSDSNCIKCTAGINVCEECRDGYFLRSNTCHRNLCNVPNCRQCNENNAADCTLCAMGFGKNGQGGCHACTDPACTECNNDPGVCTQCIDGSTLDTTTNKCSSVGDCLVAHCTQCVAGNPVSCSTCESEWAVLSNGQCGRCSDANCQSCDSSLEKCRQCKPGYTLTSYGTCSPGGTCNVVNCAACTASDPNTCDRCITGYVVNSVTGQCVTRGTCSVAKCLRCAADSPTTCIECDSGYSPDSTTGTCVATQANCPIANCNYCDSTGSFCESCRAGYSVTATGRCASSNSCLVYYCTRCVVGDRAKCSICWNGYGLTTLSTCVKMRPPNAAGNPVSLLAAALTVLVSAIVFAA